MKWLVVLLIFLVVMAMVAFRYRRQLLMGIQLWRMYQQMKAPQRRESVRPPSAPKGDLKETALARCERCGQWSPGDQMLKMGSNRYCSTKCIEKAAKLQSLIDS